MPDVQFQMLIDLMGTATDSAFWVVLAFFAVKVLNSVLLVACALYLVKKIFDIIWYCNKPDSETRLQAIHTALLGRSYRYTHKDDHHEQVLARIHELTTNYVPPAEDTADDANRFSITNT